MGHQGSISVISQLLSDEELRQCIDISESLIQVDSKSDFVYILEKRVRKLIPHECSVCGFIDKDTYAVTNMLTMDYPDGFLNNIMHDTNSSRIVESPVVKSWARGSQVIHVNDSLFYNPRYVEWTDAARKYHLKNMLVNGLEIKESRKFSYFNFTNHLRPVTVKELRVMSVLTPHLHLALSRIKPEKQAHQRDNISDLLTSREIQVLRLIENGYQNAEIAQRLSVSPYTVKNHVRHIFDKLGVRSRIAAINVVRQSATPRAEAG